MDSCSWWLWEVFDATLAAKPARGERASSVARKVAQRHYGHFGTDAQQQTSHADFILDRRGEDRALCVKFGGDHSPFDHRTLPGVVT
jgi:hypothetical protein